MVSKRVLRIFSLLTLLLCLLGFWLVYRELQTLHNIIEADPIKIIHANIHGPLLGYYQDFSEKYTRATYTFDAKGIPLFITNSGRYYHTVLISQFALGAYEYYLKTKESTA